ncbi:hypothetical protein GCM10027074_70590 [Streptomyces deserti]
MWAQLKRSLGSLAPCGNDDLAGLVRTRLKRIQTAPVSPRPHLASMSASPDTKGDIEAPARCSRRRALAFPTSEGVVRYVPSAGHDFFDLLPLDGLPRNR